MENLRSRTGARRAPKMLVLAALALLLAVLAGCAAPPMSVGHLKRDEWSLDQARTLQMKFLRFDYQVQPVGDVAGITGWAYLDMAKLPVWVKWLDSLQFTAYICQADGSVVAKDTRTFLPREAKGDVGVPFEFSLRPEVWGDKPLFITFGYRLTLTEGRGLKGRDPFFASEDATER